ncbi:hypothetical protein Tco_0984269 [Tanacetum coccineum]
MTRPVSTIGGQGLVVFKSTGGEPIHLSVSNPFAGKFCHLPHLQKLRTNAAVGVIEGCTNHISVLIPIAVAHGLRFGHVNGLGLDPEAFRFTFGATKPKVKSMDHENEGEVNPNTIEAEELEKYIAQLENWDNYIQLIEGCDDFNKRNPDDVCSLYESIIAIEKGKEQSQISPILCAQYSRFRYMVFGKGKGGKEGHDNLSAACFIETEELSSIFLEFLYHFGDAQSIKKSNVRHLKLFLHQKSSSESKKRHQESYSASYRTKVAKNGAQDHCAAGYGVQTQATQAQDSNGPCAILNRGLMTHIMLMEQAVPQQVYAQSIVAATMPPAQQSAAVAPA